MKLRPFQIEGVNFLRSKNKALLADEMGLGKTPQAVVAAKDLQNILVICPSVAKYNWQNEFKKFSGRQAFIAEKKNKPTDHDRIVICSFEYAAKHLVERPKSRFWDVLIIDEAHYLKEPTSARTVAILGADGPIHSTRRIWALTGTPAPNHAGELWVWLYNFGMTKLSYGGFTARYCETYREGNHYSRVRVTGSNVKMTHEIKPLLKKFSLRRLKKDVLKELPPVTHSVIPIEAKEPYLEPEVRSRLREEFEALQERLDFYADASDDMLLSMLQGMSQSISSLRRYHGLSKVRNTAKAIRQELTDKAYDKIVIFGVHTIVLQTMRESLSEFKSVIVTGAQSAKEKFEAQNQFQNDAETKIFFGNIKAAGTNLTLTKANEVVLIEADWIPGNNQQAIDRTHRIGQTLPVNARIFVVKDSVDEKVMNAVYRKVREIKTFIE